MCKLNAFESHFAGMSPTDCDHQVVLADVEGVTLEDYYIYDGTFGRITSQYVYQDGGIVHKDDGGEYTS